MTDAIRPEPAETPARKEHAATAIWSALKRADPGTLAALRRADPDNPPPAFYRLSVDLLDRRAPSSGAGRDALEARWAALTSILARGLDFLGALPLGAAMARAGVSEMRLLRILESHDATLFTSLRAAVHQLVSKGQIFAPEDIADLILSDGRGDEQSVRRRVSRDFYRFEGS